MIREFPGCHVPKGYYVNRYVGRNSPAEVPLDFIAFYHAGLKNPVDQSCSKRCRIRMRSCCRTQAMEIEGRQPCMVRLMKYSNAVVAELCRECKELSPTTSS